MKNKKRELTKRSPDTNVWNRARAHKWCCLRAFNAEQKSWQKIPSKFNFIQLKLLWSVLIFHEKVLSLRFMTHCCYIFRLRTGLSFFSSLLHTSIAHCKIFTNREGKWERGVRSFIICTSISVITFVLTVKFALRQNAGRYHTKHTQATLRTWRADRKKMHFNVNLISIKVELKKTLPNEKLCHSNSNLQTILKRWLLQEKVLQPWTITIMKWTRW